MQQLTEWRVLAREEIERVIGAEIHVRDLVCVAGQGLPSAGEDLVVELEFAAIAVGDARHNMRSVIARDKSDLGNAREAVTQLAAVAFDRRAEPVKVDLLVEAQILG